MSCREFTHFRSSEHAVQNLKPDSLECQDEDVGDGEAAPSVSPSGKLFGRMMSVAGLNHIIHNASAQHRERCMVGWPMFTLQLKAVAKMLGKTHSRERFIHHCLRASDAGTEVEKLFMHNCPEVKEWRWGYISQCLEHLLPLQTALRTYWDPAKYGSSMPEAAPDNALLPDEQQVIEPEAQDDSQPRLGEVTAAIGSLSFWGYAHMCAATQRILDSFLRWAESCSCCSPEERCLSAKTSMFSTCPLSGKNAVAFASGEWRAIFDNEVAAARFSGPHVRASHTCKKGCREYLSVSQTHSVRRVTVAPSTMDDPPRKSTSFFALSARVAS